MNNGAGEPAGEIVGAAKAQSATEDAAERAMRASCPSAHAILFLNIINLLRKEALKIRPDLKFPGEPSQRRSHRAELF